MGALGSWRRASASTDRPPTPESKNRMGAFASMARHWASPGVDATRIVARPNACATSTAMPAYLQDGLLAFLLGYLLGAIPFGLVLTRAAGKGDIRQVGSGNIGATNVLRTG